MCKVIDINSSVAVEVAEYVLLGRSVRLPPVYIEEVSLFTREYQINIMLARGLRDIAGLSRPFLPVPCALDVNAAYELSAGSVKTYLQ